MIRCAITDRSQFPGNEADRAAAVVAQAAGWADLGVDYIQLREKDLPAAPLATLARAILAALNGSPTQLLINARADVALATGAHGVHLTASSDELTPTQIRTLYANRPAPTISISCHTLEEVTRAAAANVDLILLGPIFEKSLQSQPIAPGIGLAILKAACIAAGTIPVLALGGVTAENLTACLEAGAAGIAGIRLFA